MVDSHAPISNLLRKHGDRLFVHYAFIAELRAVVIEEVEAYRATLAD